MSLSRFSGLCTENFPKPLPGVPHRLVKFESFEEFHGSRVRPPYILVTKIGVFFILLFAVGDYANHGFDSTFMKLAATRLAATMFSISIITVAGSRAFRRCWIKAVMVLGAISLMIMMFSYTMFEPRFYYGPDTWAYYLLATIILAPLLTVRLLLSIHLPLVVITASFMKYSGISNDRTGEFILFTVPALLFVSFILYAFRKKAFETYDLAYRNHVFMTLDSLSSLLNRGTWYRECSSCWEESRRRSRRISFIMLDIDHFKSINDNWGHDCGDKVIRAVSSVLMNRTREGDIVGRLGGEEFGIILPDTGLEDARDIAERIRQSVADENIEHKGAGIRVTISIGVVMSSETIHDFDSLVSSGDKRLYMAKEQGRNRVIAG
ncbi:MAG TPA: GGDEF domain-containing protein [Spirochaetota bacterium]